MRILLVEDNYLVGVGLAQMLTQQGCEVIGPFATESAAREAVDASSPDAALLDYSIKGGTSVSVALALRAKGCPFVFLTGYSDLPGLPAGLRDIPCLTKPIDSRSLEATLDRLRAPRP